MKQKAEIIGSLSAKRMAYEDKGNLLSFKGDWPKQNRKIVINISTGSFIVAVDDKKIATNKYNSREKWIKELREIVGL